MKMASFIRVQKSRVWLEGTVRLRMFVLFFMFIKIECIVAYLPKNNQIKEKK